MTQTTMKQLFCRISKVDEEKRTVTGIGASEAVDAEGEIFDYEGSKPYIEGWSAAAVKRSKGKSYGNIRAISNRDRASATSDGDRKRIARAHIRVIRLWRYGIKRVRQNGRANDPEQKRHAGNRASHNEPAET